MSSQDDLDLSLEFSLVIGKLLIIIIGNILNVIKISIYEHKNYLILTIEDNGKGIEEDERNLVFTPFYRGDKARNLENNGNVGLGLAITKEIIMGHYGAISLGKSKNLRGLLVKIKLPVARNDSND